MKKLVLLFALVTLVSLCAEAQSYSEINGGQWCRDRHYGAASFAADSLYVWDGAGRWVWLSAAYDTTAGTVTPLVCINNDSTNAFPLVPGVNGGYGGTYTGQIKGLKWLRVKGAVPVTLIVR